MPGDAEKNITSAPLLPILRTLTGKVRSMASCQKEGAGGGITLMEEGDYTNLEWQLNQVEDGIASGTETLAISPIFSNVSAGQIDMIRAKGIPVIVIITSINTVTPFTNLLHHKNNQLTTGLSGTRM